MPLACVTIAVKVTGEFWVMLGEDAASVVDVFTTAALMVTATAPEVDGLNAEEPA